MTQFIFMYELFTKVTMGHVDVVGMALIWMVWAIIAMWWVEDFIEYREEVNERKGA